MFFKKKKIDQENNIKESIPYTVKDLPLTVEEWRKFRDSKRLYYISDSYVEDVSPYLIKVTYKTEQQYSVETYIEDCHWDDIGYVSKDLCVLYDYRYLSCGENCVLSKENFDNILQDLKIIKPLYKLKGIGSSKYFFKFGERYIESETPNYYEFLYNRGFRDESLYELVSQEEFLNMETTKQCGHQNLIQQKI